MAPRLLAIELGTLRDSGGPVSQDRVCDAYLGMLYDCAKSFHDDPIF